MAQPLHHSFILRPPSSCSTQHTDTKKIEMPSVAIATTRTCSPLPQVIPSLTLCQDKTLTSPPVWSHRRYPRPTVLIRKFNNDSRLRQEFEPPAAPAYWKDRCQHFQQVCQTSRKRIRDMEEDQRQLRRRIHKLEEQMTLADTTPSAHRSSVPAMIVTETKTKECLYLADCEGMSDSEYGQHYYNFDDDEEE